MRGEIIWNKGNNVSQSTAWGSWRSPSNPTLRDVHEYILIFSKGTFARKNPNKRRVTISRDEFLDFTKSVWTFSAVSARSIGHPAPFPLKMPRRLIQLYTYKNEVVLDPFIGSGQTAIAAIETIRDYIGYENCKKYLKVAERRINDFIKESKLLKPSIRFQEVENGGTIR